MKSRIALLSISVSTLMVLSIFGNFTVAAPGDSYDPYKATIGSNTGSLSAGEGVFYNLTTITNYRYNLTLNAESGTDISLAVYDFDGDHFISEDPIELPLSVDFVAQYSNNVTIELLNTGNLGNYELVIDEKPPLGNVDTFRFADVIKSGDYATWDTAVFSNNLSNFDMAPYENQTAVSLEIGSDNHTFSPGNDVMSEYFLTINNTLQSDDVALYHHLLPVYVNFTDGKEGGLREYIRSLEFPWYQSGQLDFDQDILIVDYQNFNMEETTAFEMRIDLSTGLVNYFSLTRQNETNGDYAIVSINLRDTSIGAISDDPIPEDTSGDIGNIQFSNNLTSGMNFNWNTTVINPDVVEPPFGNGTTVELDILVNSPTFNYSDPNLNLTDYFTFGYNGNTSYIDEIFIFLIPVEVYFNNGTKANEDTFLDEAFGLDFEPTVFSNDTILFEANSYETTWQFLYSATSGILLEASIYQYDPDTDEEGTIDVMINNNPLADSSDDTDDDTGDDKVDNSTTTTSTTSNSTEPIDLEGLDLPISVSPIYLAIIAIPIIRRKRS